MNAYFYWNCDPEITKLFGIFPLRYYSLLFITGIILSWLTLRRIFKREGLPAWMLDGMALYIILGGLIGARLGHCLFYEPHYYLSHPEEIFLPIKKIGDTYRYIGYQGLASHGGAMGVLIAIVTFSLRNSVHPLWFLDKLAVTVPLCGAFIRIGNFMNSEIIGKPTDAGYGVIFQRVDTIPRHPAQLYEALCYIFIFLLLTILYRRFSPVDRPAGLLFGMFLILVFTARFLLEFVKENQVRFEDGILLNMGQLLSIPFILIGILLLYKARKDWFRLRAEKA